jgi:hypothetical protein
LVILPSLAVKVGVNEALVLQQLHYWLSSGINNKRINNRGWIYNTHENWLKQFPFFSKSTLKRSISHLVDLGIVIVDNFNKDKFDKTNWYSIDYEKLSLLEQDQKKFDSDFSKKKLLSRSEEKLKKTSEPYKKIDEVKMNSWIRSKRYGRKVQNDPILYKEKKTTNLKNTLSLSLSDNDYNKKTKDFHEEIKIEKFIINKEKISQIISVWSEIVGEGKKVVIREAKEQWVLEQIKRNFDEDIEKWKKYCQIITKSKFLMGEVNEFKASLLWSLKDEIVNKILCGKYGVGDRKQKRKEFDKMTIMNSIENILEPDSMKKLRVGLLEKHGAPIYNSWFQKMYFSSFSEGVLILETDNKFIALYIETQYRKDLLDLCRVSFSSFVDLKIVDKI